MSTNYFIYVEAYVGARWISIDPVIPILNENDDRKYDGTYELKHRCSYWNGSRSYFGETFTKLRHIGCEMKFSDMSDDVKEHWKNAVELEQTNNDELNWYSLPIQVDYDVFCKYVNHKQFDSHGLVSKDALFAYENGDLEELYPVEHEEFVDLTPEERQAYVYYEWDEPFGWNIHFKDIYKSIHQIVSKFKEENYIFSDDKVKFRIIVIQC